MADVIFFFSFPQMFEKVIKETNRTISNYVPSVSERFSELCTEYHTPRSWYVRNWLNFDFITALITCFSAAFFRLKICNAEIS